MEPEAGRRLGDAAQEAARRATVVADMVRATEAAGLVALERDAVDYIPPTDPRITDLVEGGSDWANYTARLKDGGLYQEGGVRRRLWTTTDKARAALAAKAALLVTGTNLFTLLEAFLAARSTRGEGLSVLATVWADDALRQALAERIRERAQADDETGRIRQPIHWALLADLGVDQATIRRLRGDKTPSLDELQAAGGGRRTSTSEELQAALDRTSGIERIAVHAPDAPFVDRSDPRVTRVIEGKAMWWRYAAVLDNGDIHYEGGLRRMRQTDRAGADALIEARLAELLTGDDLRVLLFTRGRLAVTPLRPSAMARLVDDEALRERLDARIRELAEVAQPAPPLRPHHATQLLAAGVPDATVRRLIADHTRAADDGERPPSAAARAAAAEQELEDLVDERAAAGFVTLAEDVIPYLAKDDPAVATLFPVSPPWCSHAALLSDGSIHFEGGRTRLRLVPPDLVAARVTEAVEQTLINGDIYTLCEIVMAARSEDARSAGAASLVGAFVTDEKRRGRLFDRIRELSVDPRFVGKVGKHTHQAVIRELTSRS